MTVPEGRHAIPLLTARSAAVLIDYDDFLISLPLHSILNGAPQNHMMEVAFKTSLAETYPKCRLVITEETMTVEGMIKITYELLRNKLNISRIKFVSGNNTAIEDLDVYATMERCPLCSIALDEYGRCPKCGYSKKQD